MSLPTTIKFLDENLRWVTDEFYNAGWWVPDDTGKQIASLYQDEEGWKYVLAYGRIYDVDGYPVGEFDRVHELKFYAEERCRELREEIDHPVKKERKNPDKLANKKDPTKSDGILLPVIRNIMPALIASEIVGVQPMTGDELDKLRSEYSEEQKEMIVSVRYDSTPQEDKRSYFTGDTSLHRLTEGDRVKILPPIHKDFEKTNDKIGTIITRDGEYLSIILDKSGVEVEQYPNEVQRIR